MKTPYSSLSASTSTPKTDLIPPQVVYPQTDVETLMKNSSSRTYLPTHSSQNQHSSSVLSSDQDSKHHPSKHHPSKYQRVSLNRRMFLRGLGGACFALPHLPSLLSSPFAQEPPPQVSPNFLAICNNHGGIWAQNLHPSSDLLTQSLRYAQRDIRYGTLPYTPNEQGRIHLSPVYTADASTLTASLLSKTNIYRGLDIPYRIGHHRGGHLGNFADTDGGVTGGIKNDSYHTATIDQFMAYSPSFYGENDLNSRMTQRSFCLRSGQYSQNFTRPQSKSGRVVGQSALSDNHDLHQFLFNPGSALGGVDSYLIDRVKQGYDRLKRHPRLSRGDRNRLDQHVDQMFEVERKLRVSAGLSEIPPLPSQNSTYHSGNHSFYHNQSRNIAYCDLMADVVALAFSTGVSRIGTWSQDLKFLDILVNDWHGQVAHSGMGATAAQEWIVNWHQSTFEHVLMRLAYKLDQITMADGQTLLDHSLVMMTSESGQYTHHDACANFPVITVGRAGGYFNTGLFVDYGNQEITYRELEAYRDQMPLDAEHPGLYYNQFLANVLYSMGIPRTEFAHFREFTADGPQRSEITGGYGFHYVNPNRASDYLSAKAVMNEPLPVVTS